MEAGSIPYSAVTQPVPLPAIQRGTLSCAEAVQITRVSPDRDQRRAGRGAHEARLDRRSGAARPVRARSCARAPLTPSTSTARQLDVLDRDPAASAGSACPARANASVSPVHRKRYSPSPSLRGFCSSRVLSACSTWRASAAPGADERHLRAEHPLQHRADQRVVGAAEDHRVDVRPRAAARTPRARSPRRARRTARPPG